MGADVRVKKGKEWFAMYISFDDYITGHASGGC